MEDREISELKLPYYPDKKAVLDRFTAVATSVADHILSESPIDGIPYWDGGAPGLYKIEDYKNKPADPYNRFEPVDASAAAISVQGLFRLSRYLREKDYEKSSRYFNAAMTMMTTLLNDEYLSLEEDHQGLLLHSIYHQPRGWDNVRKGQAISNCESSMWGDYHLLEAGVYLQKLLSGKEYLTFFDI